MAGARLVFAAAAGAAGAEGGCVQSGVVRVVPL